MRINFQVQEFLTRVKIDRHRIYADFRELRLGNIAFIFINKLDYKPR